MGWGWGDKRGTVYPCVPVESYPSLGVCEDFSRMMSAKPWSGKCHALLFSWHFVFYLFVPLSMQNLKVFVKSYMSPYMSQYSFLASGF